MGFEVLGFGVLEFRVASASTLASQTLTWIEGLGFLVWEWVNVRGLGEGLESSVWPRLLQERPL